MGAPRCATGMPAARPQAARFPPQLLAASRPYVTVVKYDRDDVLEKLQAFHDEVLSTNWADYLNLVYNGPFWEAEFERVTAAAEGSLHDSEIGGKFKETQ